MNSRILCKELGMLVAAVCLSACQVTDADLESGSLTDFSLTPAATEVSSFEVNVDISGVLAFTSDDNATLDISVNGDVVHSESFEASGGLDIASSPTVALARAGGNEIVAVVRYQGSELSQRATVNVVPPAPVATFPPWSNAFTQNGTVAVAVDSAWDIREVAYAVDGGAWLVATSLGGSDFDVVLEDLDIADSALELRVTTENLGHEQVHLFRDTIKGVLPVFDCGQASSMLPNRTLLGDNRTEVRSMVGYFGDPAGGHTLTFVIEFTDDNGDNFVNPAIVLTKGRRTVDVQYNVDQFRCNNNPCADTYDLSLFVDGQEVCSQIDFGTISEF